jgi:hypothetical protein
VISCDVAFSGCEPRLFEEAAVGPGAATEDIQCRSKDREARALGKVHGGETWVQGRSYVDRCSDPAQQGRSLARA